MNNITFRTGRRVGKTQARDMLIQFKNGLKIVSNSTKGKIKVYSTDNLEVILWNNQKQE